MPERERCALCTYNPVTPEDWKITGPRNKTLDPFSACLVRTVSRKVTFKQCVPSLTRHQASTWTLPDPTTMSGFPTVTVAVKSSPLNSASPCQLTNFCCCVWWNKESRHFGSRSYSRSRFFLRFLSRALTWKTSLERTLLLIWWMICALRLPVLSMSPTMTGNA